MQNLVATFQDLSQIIADAAPNPHLSYLGVAILWVVALQPPILLRLWYMLAKNRKLSWLGTGFKSRLPSFLDLAFSLLIAFMLIYGTSGSLSAWPVTFPLGLILLQLSLFDARYLWLPDRLTIPLAIIGLLLSLSNSADLLSSVAGFGFGYLVFWIVQQFFRHMRGYEGLGSGDVKLSAAIGAWLGYELWPLALLVACFAGLLGVAGTRFFIKQPKNTKIPFGLYLATAFWLVWQIKMFS